MVNLGFGGAARQLVDCGSGHALSTQTEKRRGLQRALGAKIVSNMIRRVDQCGLRRPTRPGWMPRSSPAAPAVADGALKLSADSECDLNMRTLVLGMFYALTWSK
jgi:hypothetical protein